MKKHDHRNTDTEVYDTTLYHGCYWSLVTGNYSSVSRKDNIGKRSREKEKKQTKKKAECAANTDTRRKPGSRANHDTEPPSVRYDHLTVHTSTHGLGFSEGGLVSG